MSFAEAVNFLFRMLVRQAIGWPAGTVVPANTPRPEGKTCFATVLLKSFEGAGWPSRVVSTIANSTSVNVSLYNQYVVESSVQFFKVAGIDTKGLPLAGRQDAYDLAIRLPTLLQAPACLEKLYLFGLCFNGAGTARDLTSISRQVYESRGAVDITLSIVNRESFIVATYNALEFSLKTSTPSDALTTTNIEVSS